MSALVTAFEQLIPSNFLLTRESGCWIVKEPGAGNSRFEIAGGKSHAFTLDQGGITVFPFFTNAALKGVKSVNDAIVVAVVGQDTYVVAVELKTSNGKTSEALKQIESGRLFAAWVRQLLSFYGHWTGGPCKFFGVVSLKPRRQPRKGGSRRTAELPIPRQSTHGADYPYFVLENHPRVSIADLVQKIPGAPGTC
ncbi:hypothetical protein CLU85_0137 [Acidovorax sp. 69]|uniref:hypothetical protein n=1 Tax=Acidovorax sp. 69 TaxID=2035202 RepID=UPI000C2361D0|nr:hypothetical protein [Acidovorax sp. 69]PJI95430.1 hypothetical protein CLU85_0137 [Acidovorax sp. 69]